MQCAGVIIKSLPWIQPDKCSQTSADGFRDMIVLAQSAYQLFYNKCADKTNLPDPKPIGSILSGIGVFMSDNAPNEGKREKIVEEYIGKVVEKAKCLHHTLMLASKDVRKSCHKTLVEKIGKHRDQTIQEFGTNNVIDSLQLQLHKEFGHLCPYAFGHGGVDFPAWMRDKHKDAYVGMDRIIGNRSMVFLRNALVHNFMAPYYLEFLDFCINEVGEYNKLALRTFTKVGCQEVLDNIKARALIFVHILHPLLVLSQSKMLGPGSKRIKGQAFFLDQGPFIRRAHAVAGELSRDPIRLLEKGFDIFDHPNLADNPLVQAVRREHKVWAEKPKNKMLINCLFDDLPVDDLLPVLRSHSLVLEERFVFGVLADFQPGGRFFDKNEALLRCPALAHTPINSDTIERVFGVYSDKKARTSANTSLHVVSGLATYVGNKTSDWLRKQLVPSQALEVNSTCVSVFMCLRVSVRL